MDIIAPLPTREQLIHALYEAAELEHNLMCTYLYAAFSLKEGEEEGLSAEEAAAVARWKRCILEVAIEEMGHLAAVWNITAALGGAPHFGRENFPLSRGGLPAGIVVKLAPFNEAVLQHFVHLERPISSDEPDGEGFTNGAPFRRGAPKPRLIPMGIDYATVGEFYAVLERDLSMMAQQLGEAATFCGDPALQLSPREVDLGGAKPVLCLKTAIGACETIVAQGEGARADQAHSHFNKFLKIRGEYAELKRKNPAFVPAHPAAVNPVLRPPPNPEGRVWLEDEAGARVVDVANSAYQLMLRLISYSYSVPSPHPEKALAVDLSIELMRAMSALGESAARRPAGPSNPGCNAGVSFTALRDSAPLPRGPAARRFFVERLRELADGAVELDQSDHRIARATRMIEAMAERGQARFASVQDAIAPAGPAGPSAPSATLEQRFEDGWEIVEGEKIQIRYRAKLCIHSRFCVTGAPKVFLANVQGPWIHPDDMDVEELAAVARACPSGAIQYSRKDNAPEEQFPPVNLVRVLEHGPNAFRGDLRIDGLSIGARATLCRCGASKNKPYCDGSHHDVQFDASGEPATGEQTQMLPVRDGPLEITPEVDGPLMVRGNLEIISGTGRMVSRLSATRLCRCGHSANKPYCDGSHVRVGFKSD